MIFNKLIKREDDVIRLSINSFDAQKHILLTYLNQHCFNIYNSNSEYKKLINNNFTVFLDGFGVYAAMKFLGFKNVEKFNATDLYEKIFKQFSEKRVKLFLISGNYTDEFIAEKAEEKELTVCGYQNGYFDDEKLHGLIDTISKFSPQVIVVGMGVPQQEIIGAKISEDVKNVTILCVGGFLEFYFGTKKRAPKFFRKTGVEWFHRMIKEPRRMWKRYLVGIPVFLFEIIKIKFTSYKS